MTSNRKISLPERAALYMVGWAFSFSLAMIGNKWVQGTIPIPLILWARCGFALLFLMPFLSYEKQVLRSKNVKMQLLRGCLTSGAMICTYMAYQNLPTHTAAILGTSGVLFTFILSQALLRESIHWTRWGLLALGYMGVLIILEPMDLFTHSKGLYKGLALLGNLMGSCAVLSARVLALHKESTSTTLFLGTAIPFAVYTLLGPFFQVYTTGSFFPIGFSTRWGILLSIGGLGALSQFFYFSALRLAPASFAAPFEYLRLCIFIPLGWCLFHEIPPISFYMGALLILASAFFLVRQKHAFA